MYFMNFGVVAALAAALALVSLFATTFHGRASDVLLAKRWAAGDGELMQAPHGARTQQLWDNYWPGSHAIQARYKRVQAMVARRNKGLKQKADWDPTGRGNLADPIKFCRISFPPESFYDQEEFHACLDAIGAKKVRLQWGDSTKATDITGAPAGRDAPDGPNTLSPGSDGWSRN